MVFRHTHIAVDLHRPVGNPEAAFGDEQPAQRGYFADVPALVGATQPALTIITRHSASPSPLTVRFIELLRQQCASGQQPLL